MIYELLKNIIAKPNEFMDHDTLALQIEFFFIAGKLTEEEYNELKLLLDPPVVEPV